MPLEQDFGDWFSKGLFNTLETDSNVIRTYNRVIGVARVEVQRVDGETCPWRVGNWNSTYRIDGEFALPCFPGLGDDTKDRDPFGPWFDNTRYEAYEDKHFKGVWRYIFEMPRDQTFAYRAVDELVQSGFFDAQRTRKARVRLLTYNNGLRRPMLTETNIEAALSPTGLLTRVISTHSVPVQEYMPETWIQQTLLELGVLMWTIAQVLWEFAEFRNYVKEQGSPIKYFKDLFNMLDWTRFLIVFCALGLRIVLMLDTTRDFHVTETATFIDIEYISLLYGYYGLLTCIITIWSLLSFIQYFNLSTKLKNMKGTLATSGAELLPFMIVFALFYSTYALVGMYLFGHSLEPFMDYWNAINSCFEMMNANFPFADLEPALPRDEGIDATYIAGLFFFYSFIFLHYFVLLNMVIAIVVDSYGQVKGDQESRTVRLLKQNMGPLPENVSSDFHRWGLTFWVYLGGTKLGDALAKYIPELKHEYLVPWSDPVWLTLLEEVHVSRRARGLPSHAVQLQGLSRDVRIILAKGQLLSKLKESTSFAAGMSQDAQTSKSKPTGEKPESKRDSEKARGMLRFRGTDGVMGFSSRGLDGRIDLMKFRGASKEARTKKGANAKKSGPRLDPHDKVFQQVSLKFYSRKYYTPPSNIVNPFDEREQPPGSTWVEHTLEKLAEKVYKMEIRTTTGAIQMQRIQDSVDLVLDSMATELTTSEAEGVSENEAETHLDSAEEPDQGDQPAPNGAHHHHRRDQSSDVKVRTRVRKPKKTKPSEPVGAPGVNGGAEAPDRRESKEWHLNRVDKEVLDQLEKEWAE